jgi:hypothetical protein
MSSFNTWHQSSTHIGESSLFSILDIDLDLVQALSGSGIQKISVASILIELGCQHSTSVDAFKQVLRKIGIILDEEQVAEIIVTLLL